MSVMCELKNKNGFLYFHTYSDGGFWVRKVGTTEVLKDGWDLYHVGDKPPKYEEIFENTKEETEDADK